MASSKDVPAARTASGSFSRLSSSARQHSGSVSLSAANPAHRVSRRKSVNASASSTAQAAVAAALREHGETGAVALANSHRRSASSKKGPESQSISTRPNMHSYFSGPTSLQHEQDQDAVEDNSQDDEVPLKQGTKQRNRRASEGSPLAKTEGKKTAAELRCETCGKGYKHSSCLTKHLWEHDPAWAITSKLLISKHQQVQLLEAASVLCNMNAHATTLTTSAILSDFDMALDQSEASSASPGYSGSSEIPDEASSVETTPPPMSDHVYPVPDSKRLSSGSTVFSRSYRSIASSSFAESTISPGLHPQRFSGVDFRPSTSGTDDGSLAAATAGLNVHGTPGMHPSYGADIPPVPPLPQRYQSFIGKSPSTGLTDVYSSLDIQVPSLTHQLSDERGYKGDKQESRPDSTVRGPSGFKDEGMFEMEF